MKTAEKVKNPFEPIVRYNPELDKYKDIILFPEKLARANKMCENMNVSEQIKKIKSGK